MGAMEQPGTQRNVVLASVEFGQLRGHRCSFASTALLLFGIGFATVTSSTSALVADLTQRGQYGASLGVLRTIMDVGQTIGPVLTGFLVGTWGYGVAFPALAAVLALSAAIFALAPAAPAADRLSS
jgi:MFS family permease